MFHYRIIGNHVFAFQQQELSGRQVWHMAFCTGTDRGNQFRGTFRITVLRPKRNGKRTGELRSTARLTDSRERSYGVLTELRIANAHHTGEYRLKSRTAGYPHRPRRGDLPGKAGPVREFVQQPDAGNMVQHVQANDCIARDALVDVASRVIKDGHARGIAAPPQRFHSVGTNPRVVVRQLFSGQIRISVRTANQQRGLRADTTVWMMKKRCERRTDPHRVRQLFDYLQDPFRLLFIDDLKRS